jgi:hypothetical protein
LVVLVVVLVLVLDYEVAFQSRANVSVHAS